MKKLVAAFAVLLGCAPGALPAEPAPLTTLHAIAALSNAEADRLIPVAVPATITYYRPDEGTMFIEDGGTAMFVQLPDSANSPLVPGDRVLVRGKTQGSFRPQINSQSVSLLHHGVMPPPTLSTYDQLIRGERDCDFVSIHGIVRTVDMAVSAVSPLHNSIVMQMLTDGGLVHISLDSTDLDSFKDLLDAEIEVLGVVSGRFDGKDQLTGIDLNVFTPANIHVVKRAQSNPWSLPFTSMDQILVGVHEEGITKRVLVHGVVTYYQPGSSVVLQNGTQSLRIMTESYAPLRLGDMADATGFPDLYDGFPTLTRAEVWDRGPRAFIQPQPVTWTTLASGSNTFDLVSIEGLVVTEVREAGQDEYVLNSHGKLFSAIYYHPSRHSGLQLPEMKSIPVGAQVRVLGICLEHSSDLYNGAVPFDILLRSFDDIQVVTRASLLTVRNMSIVSFSLFFGILIVGGRSWLVARRARRETNAIAYLERRRRCVLEEISGSRPLPEIIDQITELVSFRLKGAPCWCEVADGGNHGNRPEDLTRMRVVQIEIPARSGPPLGTILAAFPMRTRSSAEQVEAVSMGAGLASLAIGTRRLYSDLIHRSEFDLLTDIQNRFSMEKHLDTLVEEARRGAGVFGLIYIDLDGFKQINDRYGHQVGDIYLREAAARMKHQLRPADLLARIGGDEFAVLVPMVTSRAEVQKIADRLEHCFHSPFTAHNHAIEGAASIGIALYPEDADNREDLLRVADHAMYLAKNARKASAARLGKIELVSTNV